VGEMAGAAMDQGRHLLDSAREQATGFVDQRKDDLAQSVVNLANSLRDSGSAFEDRQQIRALVDSAAGGLEQLAKNIRAAASPICSTTWKGLCGGGRLSPQPPPWPQVSWSRVS